MAHHPIDGRSPKLQVLIQPNIGLDSDARHSVVDILNHMLASEAVLTVKNRGAHWNVSGAGFFEQNIIFDSHYKQLNDISDKIAARARMLGGTAIGSLQEFINYSLLGENPGAVPDILDLLADHETIIRLLREDAKKCSEEYEDEGTHNFLVDILCQHENMAWMLRSYIEPQLTDAESVAGKKQPVERNVQTGRAGVQ